MVRASKLQLARTGDLTVVPAEQCGELGWWGVTPRVREAVVVPGSLKEREPLPLYVPETPVAKDNKVFLDWLDEHGVTQS